MRPHDVMRQTETMVKAGAYKVGGAKVVIGKAEQHKSYIRQPAESKKAYEEAPGAQMMLPVEVKVVPLDTLDAAYREHCVAVAKGHDDVLRRTAPSAQSLPGQLGATKPKLKSRSQAPPLQDSPSRVMVLDFASDTVPGGGARGNQIGTQEESLCRRSSLLPCLESLPYPLPFAGCAVCPRVSVFRESEDQRYALFDPQQGKHPFNVAVVACAMPSMEGAGGEEEEKVRSTKIDIVLREFHAAAQSSGIRSLVLGAWGCGAFGNDARNVALVFQRRIQHWFRVAQGPAVTDGDDKEAVSAPCPFQAEEQPFRIVFAVRGKKNFAAFQTVFSRY
mmetsp:Transcript_30150/g.60773  ORF Transcript_30150/g.60773 Transcript_30150/m.60773 type:complete len:333 (+) Transcript_30150:45-1043(+)